MIRKALLASLCVLGLAPALAAAQSQLPLQVRLRALYMDVDNSNHPDFAGGPVHANSKFFPELDLSWYFTKNISAELVLTYPQKHTITLDGTNIGSIKHLPPTLLGQWHFLPGQQIDPYVGAGINYTHFSSVNLPSGVDIGRNSVGPALQVGSDFNLNRNWSLNLDVKYVWISTDVTANGTKLTTLHVDPWLLSVGVGYRF